MAEPFTAAEHLRNEVWAMNKETDVVISSRIRFARNLAEYPFRSKLDPVSAEEIAEKVCGIFPDYEIIDFSKLDNIESTSYVEKHEVSPNFANEKLPHYLAVNREKNLRIMICEEDHIRIQCILPGFDLDSAYKNAVEADDRVLEKLKIAYSDKLGFLTGCPTNLGTGMRASVMLFLPALTITKMISGLAPSLSKLGFTIRGMYGEGSEAGGCMYQLSNSVNLGYNEETIISKLKEAAEKIAAEERRRRAILKSDNYDTLCDRIMRSYGNMHYAHMITSAEFLKLYADVRLGIALGMINDLEYSKLDRMLQEAMPATLMINYGQRIEGDFRDKLRAEYTKKELDA